MAIEDSYSNGLITNKGRKEDLQEQSFGLSLAQRRYDLLGQMENVNEADKSNGVRVEWYLWRLICSTTRLLMFYHFKEVFE